MECKGCDVVDGVFASMLFRFLSIRRHGRFEVLGKPVKSKMTIHPPFGVLPRLLDAGAVEG